MDKTDSLSIGELMGLSGVGFGTSGARGLATTMTDRVCYAYTVGFLQYLERCDRIRPGDAVALAGDRRPSTPRIMAACQRACQELGYRPINCGELPTPAVAAFGEREGIASLMVTGSHIPDDRNGIKFYKPDGEILKADEEQIREQVVDLPQRLFDPDTGNFVEPETLPPADLAAYRHYVARYLDVFPPEALSGTRVLLYAHSTVAAPLMAEVLAGLGAEVVTVGESTVFVPVDTEAIRPEDIDLGREWAATQRFDAIVSADGDGDRPLVGDERGEWLRGDLAGILVARYLDADCVVTPVSSNSALERSGWFAAVRRTRIGSPFVIEAMQEAAAEGYRRVVGFEANGGFLLQTPIDVDDRQLPALPTRDALIVALTLLLSARAQGRTLSQLRAQLPARYTASDRLKAFPTELAQRQIAALREGGAAAIEAAFPQLGTLRQVDETDGLRLQFASGEILHLRPSGNAPELRCYNEADSAERVAALNAQCLAQLARWREEAANG